MKFALYPYGYQNFEKVINSFYIFIDLFKAKEFDEFNKAYENLKIQSLLNYYYKPPTDIVDEAESIVRNR